MLAIIRHAIDVRIIIIKIGMRMFIISALLQRDLMKM